MTEDQDLLKGVEQFFSEKVNTYGPNYRGADYGSAERQAICFAQLTKLIVDPAQPFSINDYGCGYGALIDYLDSRGFQYTYTGYDISKAMIQKAKEGYGQRRNCSFVDDEGALKPADFTIAGGIFNIKLDAGYEEWTEMILRTLDRLWALSDKGLAFNILTKYSDPERMRTDLYYADPCFMFDYCKRHFSKEVALLHDYGVYEFTILVRRNV